VIATAILDRLLHHGITVAIRGDSYRLKEHIKTGLLKGAEATSWRTTKRATAEEFSMTITGENWKIGWPLTPTHRVA
jgi:IstB-like ATP binding protein